MTGPVANPRVLGSCHGYGVRSELTFRTLRSGGGTPLQVNEVADLAPEGELLSTWRPRPGNPFHGRLLKDGSRYAFWASDAGWYLVDPSQPSITVEKRDNELRRELRLFGVPVALCTFEQGDISVHASAIEIDGQGVLLAGPSRYGKTTLAAGFLRAGHRLLSEDTSRCSASGPPTVFPGPSVLRLRSDVARRLEIRTAPPAESEDDRVPLIVDERWRGDGVAVPLRAIILLDHGGEPATLRSVPSMEALRDILALTFRLPTEGYGAACFSRVADLMAKVETLRLHRRMTIQSLDEVVSLVERHVAASG